jgi:predicted Zn-dependent protease with MMP-like domain/predicted Zn-dependent protease
MSRQDRLTADVERGFDALEQGNVEDAEACLQRCRRIDPKHPDAVALAAALADARGDVDAALAGYAQLVELRPDEPAPRICLARLQLHDRDDPDAALDTLDAAFELIDEEADLIEAIVVRTEALIAIDDLEDARGALAELSSSAIDDAALALDLAELALAAEDPRAALRWADVARTDGAIRADALHLLGRIHEASGDRGQMIAAWQEVRVLDAAAPPGPVAVSEDELERMASAALHELPADVRARLEHVPILIDDGPSEDIVAEGFDPRLLGLFQGAAMPDAGSAVPTVTNILLFKTNLERAVTDLDQLAEEVRITVLHETAHYFGLDEDDLERLGLD